MSKKEKLILCRGRSLSDRLGNRQGRSSGKNREERTTKTAEDLDKEMDSYMNVNEDHL